MYCTNCGKEIPQITNFCTSCGTLAPVQITYTMPINPDAAKAIPINPPIWLFCALGGLVGAMVGFISRPSAMFLGQLPFSTVINAGSDLQGFDRILVPIAQQSFNQMMAWAMVCAVLGGFAGAMLRRSPPSTAA